MSRGFVKEGDQEEVPMVLPRAFLPKNVPNYVTEEGLKLLQEEMLALKQERASAGSNYVHKNYIDAKINLLSERLNSAVLLDVKNRKGDADVVSFGSYVKFNDKVVRIVGVDEADASKGLISFVSPIAKALIGKKKGDKVEVKLPKGVEVIEIQGVFESYELRAMSREPEVRKVKNISSKTEGKHTVVQSPQPPANSPMPIVGTECSFWTPRTDRMAPTTKLLAGV